MTEPALSPVEQALYTPKEVSAVCRMPYNFVLQQIRDGGIPAKKFGRIWKVPAAWVREQVGRPAAPVLHVVPESPASAPDYEPLAAVLDILGRALVEAAASLRRAS